ncbi:hypothetical protein PTT_00197 [Pyrenophora teres f. teres 0-1]|uniref:Uncharacterized protein n=1 Tax=Pyrenophora teres f. teres (strain 0-1) TaxID=861557 RepID=E3RCC5_PYRTT|nr:hypothetical protein PTT_00197 [Pyrenophora teres f. teres 0-1]
MLLVDRSPRTARAGVGGSSVVGPEWPLSCVLRLSGAQSPAGSGSCTCTLKRLKRTDRGFDQSTRRPRSVLPALCKKALGQISPYPAVTRPGHAHADGFTPSHGHANYLDRAPSFLNHPAPCSEKEQEVGGVQGSTGQKLNPPRELHRGYVIRTEPAGPNL